MLVCHPAPEQRRRFVEEARVAGQLQHPGIPPVHEIGELEDGRPYYTMKLIDGQTLAAVLAARPDPRHDLARFVAIPRPGSGPDHPTRLDLAQGRRRTRRVRLARCR